MLVDRSIDPEPGGDSQVSEILLTSTAPYDARCRLQDE
jgi:hypothetical protein